MRRPVSKAARHKSLKFDRLLRPQGEPATRQGVESQKPLSNLWQVRDDLLASAL